MLFDQTLKVDWRMNDLVVIGNEDLMWIQEPFHINNGGLKL